MLEASDPERVGVLLAQGRALKRSGAYPAALVPLAEAAREASRRGDAASLARAAAAYNEASIYLGRAEPRWLDLARRAVEALPDDPTPLRVTALATLSHALHFAGRSEESDRYGDQALAMARLVGDRHALAAVLRCRMSAWGRRPENAVEQLVLGAELDTLGDPGEDGRDETIFAIWLVAEAAARLGDLGPWDSFAARQQDLALFRLPFLEHSGLMRRQLRAVLAGDLEGAVVLLREAEEFGQRLGWGLGGIYAMSGILLRREQGRLPGLAPALRMIAARSDGLWTPGLALLHAALGMSAEATAYLERATADDLAGLPRDDTRPVVVALLAEACALLADCDRARPLIAELERASGTLVISPPMGVCLGPVDRLAGNLLAVVGEPEEAERRLTAALAFSRGLPSPLWVAHCLHDLARVVGLQRPAEGVALLSEAEALSARHGLVDLAGRAEAMLREL